MHRYSAFSLIIDSELEFPELTRGSGIPDLVMRLGSVAAVQRPATIEDELAFPQCAGRFHIRAGREIIVDPYPGTAPGVLRTLLLGKVMACLLRQRGYLPLHASAVAVGGCGVLFIGDSGAGKSTTAAAFHARGHSVLADDVGALRIAPSGVELQPAWSGLRLLADARRLMRNPGAAPRQEQDKHVFSLQQRHTSAVPVRRIYMLAYRGSHDPTTVRTDVLPGFMALALLNCHSFLRPWIAGPELKQVNLNRSSSIAAAIRVQRLVRPRSLDCLPALVDFVERDVACHG